MTVALLAIVVGSLALLILLRAGVGAKKEPVVAVKPTPRAQTPTPTKAVPVKKVVTKASPSPPAAAKSEHAPPALVPEPVPSPAALKSPDKRFDVVVLGGSAVGKTSLLKRLVGVKFSRKAGHVPTLAEEATCTELLCSTASGEVIAFRLYDLAWAEARRKGDISRELARGKDGFVYVMDVGEKMTVRDFADYSSWYELACGFDRPALLVSNKSDLKKRAVLENEGPALAKHRRRGAHVVISLADDSGVDELVTALVRLFTEDSNVQVVKFGPQ